MSPPHTQRSLGGLRVEADNADPAVAFAAEELRRVLGRLPAQGGRPWVFRLRAGTRAHDGFNIVRTAAGFEIEGDNPRSVLFGAYALLRRLAGCRWFHPGEERLPARPSLRRVPVGWTWRETPTFPRRYIFPEGKIMSRRLMQAFIAWAPRNGINEITISFDAWQAWHAALAPMIRARGLSLTLSGHGLAELVPKSRFRAHPDWFAERDGVRVAGGQYCFASPGFQRGLADALAAFLRRNPLVSRLSLWAEDTAVLCQCRACRQRGFLRSWAEAIAAVRRVLRRRGVRAEIGFLAYNAALAWEMLEPPPGKPRGEDAVELAYWGRDYRFPFARSRLAADRRAMRCMRAWRRRVRGELSVLEYYTDIWMLTHLIPPLSRCLAADCRFYARLGVDALGTLICLARPEIDSKQTLADRYAPMVYPNLYFFGALTWNARLSPAALRRDYGRYRFGADAALCLKYLALLERLMPVIASFNQSLFRLRFVDVWLRDETPVDGGILFKAAEWSPATPATREERRRDRVARQLLDRLEAAEREWGWTLVGKEAACRRRAEAWRMEWGRIVARLRAICRQLDAQQALRDGHVPAATRALRAVLSAPAGLMSSERKHCRAWLRRVLAGDSHEAPTKHAPQ